MALGLDAAMQPAAGEAVWRQRVYGVQLVRGRPFYGYDAEERLFVKFIMCGPLPVGFVGSS